MHGGKIRRGSSRRRRSPLALAALAAGGLTASAVGVAGATGTHAAKAKGAPIVIGVSLSLSGDFSADGQAFQRGYQLWAADQNRAGGLLGRPVQLDVVSDASSPTQVVTNYEKLITINHASLLFGPFSTLLTVPASKIANRFGYALVEGAGGAPSVFANGLHNVFDVSLPVVDNLVLFAKWIASLPPSQRPKTAAYPTSNDPFTEPQIGPAQKILEAAGVKTVYSHVFPAEVTDYTPIADAVAASKAQIVVLGSVDVPTATAFVQAFVQQHYNPKAFIATGGPDQGATFLKAVGASNANGIMVPNGWYPGYRNPSSQKMVAEYVKKYGGTPSGINSDVAEAYSVGQVMAQAVTATKSLNNATLIKYLHSGKIFSSVQGPVQFDAKGMNGAAAAFVFQWQKTNFVQVLPSTDPNSVKIQFPKANWGG